MKLSFLLPHAICKHVFKSLEISRSQTAPDCFRMDTLVVNKKFGGEELRFRQGDILNLKIQNRFDGEISIHLHGINQIGSVESDGASGVTQMAIKAGMDQTIVTFLDRPGTYMYHAHYDLYDLHIYGALIVEGDKESVAMSYDDEKTIVISDHFHKSPESSTAGLLTTSNFTWIGSADSFLTNFNSVLPNCTTNTLTTIEVDQGKVYRIRLVGATTLYITYFTIPNHKLYVVEVDGSLIKPVEVEYVEIMPGQRYSIIVRMDGDKRDYELRVEGRYRTGGPTGLSILRYKGSVNTNDTIVTTTLPGDNPGWVNTKFESLVKTDIPPNPDPPLILVGRQIKYGQNGTQRRWTINNITFEFPNSTSLLDTFKANRLDTLPISQKPLGIYKKEQMVDIVFQNTRALNGICEVHPWHLHGHVFLPISSGRGKYPEGEIELGHVPRDTIGVYGSDGEDECGWTRIRFKADNVGVWAIHCHIVGHYAMGMGGIIVVEDSVLAVSGGSIKSKYLGLILALVMWVI